MGRLIDEDVLVQRIYEYQSKAIDTEDIIYSIKTLPTAYDVETVCLQMLEKHIRGLTIDKAIEIVEAGGIDG